ncbi:MAG: Ig-like domain-containing protein [Candidatus Bathyarchaeum tardum]|nr:MAG: Ig-like domain-containing protein [Candidatus Bathyarchaeum tardum]
MQPRSKRQKLFVAFFAVLLLLLLPIPCFAEPYERNYQLLDSPDGSTSYRLTVSITESLYEYYKSKTHLMPNYDFSMFVTPDALQPIADDLWTIYDNQEDFANGVLMLVHQIPYVESDPQKYPVEVMVENEGDCDLFSIIAASIMKAGGLDVVLLLLEQHDHMWVGVNLPESPKDARSQVYFYRHDGKKYYVAETTGGNWEKGWRVGECPEILQRAAAQVIPLTNYEISAPSQVSSGYSVPDPSEILMSLSTSLAVSQNSIEISGSLTPALAGKKVTLYVSSLGSALSSLATVFTDANGNYFYSWESPNGGIYSLRANWSGDENYSGADSTTFSLVVVPPSILILGGSLIFGLVVLIIVMRAKRTPVSEGYETYEELEFEEYPDDA